MWSAAADLAAVVRPVTPAVVVAGQVSPLMRSSLSPRIRRSRSVPVVPLSQRQRKATTGHRVRSEPSSSPLAAVVVAGTYPQATVPYPLAVRAGWVPVVHAAPVAAAVQAVAVTRRPPVSQAEAVAPDLVAAQVPVAVTGAAVVVSSVSVAQRDSQVQAHIPPSSQAVAAAVPRLVVQPVQAEPQVAVPVALRQQQAQQAQRTQAVAAVAVVTLAAVALAVAVLSKSIGRSDHD